MIIPGDADAHEELAKACDEMRQHHIPGEQQKNMGKHNKK